MVVSLTACCGSDGGCLALWSRPSGGGFKPPTGALAEDRFAERVGKGAARSRQVWVGKMSDGRNPRPLPLTCRKWSDDVKTRARPIVLGSAWGSPVDRPGRI